MMPCAVEPDTSFLDRYPGGNGRLIVNAPNGSRHVFQNLSISIIEKDCPLLALSFESAEIGTPTADVDVPSLAAAISLVRFIYTRNYAWPSSQDGVSLLLTAHVVTLAHSLDYAALYEEASANLRAKVDYAGDYPSPPVDLCATIRFLWPHSCVSPIKESILNYCVAAFEQHKLGSNPEFAKLCREHFDFHMDLFRVNTKRNFEQLGIFHLPGPNRKSKILRDEDYFIACAFSDNDDEGSDDDEDIPCDNDIIFDSDEEGDEQPTQEKTQAMQLDLPTRPKENQQAGVETANMPTSPTSEASFVMVDDPFKSACDSDTESDWQVL